MMFSIQATAAAFITFALTCAALTAEDSIDSDYSAELPRIPPTGPSDSLEKFTVAPGFQIQLAAAEPLVTDPIALAFAADGSLFVVEMRGYSEDGDKNLGQIRKLVDTNEDGQFDQQSIYADDLSWPTAVTCFDGGIFVGAAPDIYYFKDTTGDNKADQKHVVFSGFGRGNVQGLLNSFRWGLDNRIHGATSSAGGTIRRIREDITISGENTDVLTLQGRDFSFDPRTLQITPTTGGGQHGMTFDPWGNRFVCSNSNHIQYVLFEDRYLARNPFLAAPSARVTIAADGPSADVFRGSPVEPWRIVRTRLRVGGVVPGPIEGGGTPAGYFTSATGLTIYRGNAWPKSHYGWAIVGDVGSNLIHRKRLEPNGVSFIGHRVDDQSEFVTSSDIWFRPVQFANGPDGTLYVADMYREVIEHPASLPPVIKRHLDLTSGRDRGRIYRIVPQGFRQPRIPRLDKMETTELVGLLDHPNGWHRETASRLLHERQDHLAVAELEKLVSTATRAEGRIGALYALDGLTALTADVVLSGLGDRNSHVREHSVRLSESLAQVSAKLRSKLYTMVDDAEIRIRYQVAFSLGELRGPQRNLALASILRRDRDNPQVRLAVSTSLETGAGAVLLNLVSDTDFRQSDAALDAFQQLASQIGRQQRPEDVAAVIEALITVTEDDEKITGAIIRGLDVKQDSDLAKRIAIATGERSAEFTKRLLKSAIERAADRNADSTERIGAIHTLRLGNLQACQEILVGLLDTSESPDIQLAALDVFANFDQSQVGSILLEHWPEFSPRVRARASDVVLSRNIWVSQVLDAVENNELDPGQLDHGWLRLVASSASAPLRQRAKSLLELHQTDRRSDVIESYREALDLGGDTVRGGQVFKKICATCHQLERIGNEIGPNLAAMRNRGEEAMLIGLLDPNREVNPQYLNYAVITRDGRQFAGILATETATSVTLRRADGKTDTLLRIDIDEIRSSGLSLMPEGLEKELDKQAVADLFEYIRSVP